MRGRKDGGDFLEFLKLLAEFAAFQNSISITKSCFQYFIVSLKTTKHHGQRQTLVSRQSAIKVVVHFKQLSLTFYREQDKEATVYVGNLDERVTDHLVWELMLQAGRIVNVHLPKDRVSQIHQGYGFVEFISEEDADYAAKIMNQVRLYGKPIRVNKASADKQKSVEVGAELFVGNLDAMVDERTLYETFSRFGTLINPPKVCCHAEMYIATLTGLCRLHETTRIYPKATVSYHSQTSMPPTMQSQTCTDNIS